ncbi:hypothetical protein J4714_13480 [Staphylococcus epidermidis]|nr:hypothetical protein [Staphylococcus epidermidis]
MNLNLDWSFFSWDLCHTNFVAKGLMFSLMLTVIATLAASSLALCWR